MWGVGVGYVGVGGGCDYELLTWELSLPRAPYKQRGMGISDNLVLRPGMEELKAGQVWQSRANLHRGNQVVST